jgi:hypothetical protein
VNLLGVEHWAFGARADIFTWLTATLVILTCAAGEDHATQTASHAAAHASLDGDLVMDSLAGGHFRNSP